MSETLGEFIDTLQEDLARGDCDRAPLIKAVQAAVRYYQKERFWFTERRLARIGSNCDQHWYGQLGWASQSAHRDCEQCRGNSYLNREDQQLCCNRGCASYVKRITSSVCDTFTEGTLQDEPWSFDEPWVEGRVTDILEIDRVWDVREECDVGYVTFKNYYEDYGADCYTRYGGQIGFTDPRDTTYLISASCRPLMPKADGDSTVFFTEAHDMLYAKTRAYFSRNTMQDFNESANWEAVAKKEYKMLKTEGAARKPAGKIQPHGVSNNWGYTQSDSSGEHGRTLRGGSSRNRW